MGSHGRDTRPRRPQNRVEDSQQLQGTAQSIQSSQRVLEELAEAFNSWDETRKSDSRANPPGYRKRNYYDQQGHRVHEEHPRSTVTWKQNGIKHDIKNNRVRLSKGANHKQHPKAWEYILIEYETRTRRHRREPTTGQSSLRQGQTAVGTSPRLQARNRNSRRTRHRDSGY
ncbi:MAG: putative transposase [Haloquadratum walsbyi J07HQW1]|uniref:Putative transposase n=1 Tax=Haloquadratum walsbyi J07HQW1 TaxID=1238424 RepID=U1PKF1_9EURY|nr:MAG: putative transposase [Haloquadratum walsbyi J07HQW1]